MKVKTLVLSNGNFEELEIDDTLDGLQALVGGYIEHAFIGDDFYERDIDLFINEEGKFIEGLNNEIVLVKRGTNKILDIIFGNCVFVSHDDEGETISLNEEQKKFIIEKLNIDVMLSNGKPSKALFI